MQRIWYANASFLVPDPVAVAVMDYASVLALVDSADVIQVPWVDQDGSVRALRLLIGPASQILAMETDEPDVDIDLDEVLADIRRRSQQRLPDSTSIARTGEPPPEEADQA